MIRDFKLATPIDFVALQESASMLIAKYGMGIVQFDPKSHDGVWYNLMLHSCEGKHSKTSERCSAGFAKGMAPTEIWHDPAAAPIRALLEPLQGALWRARLSIVPPGGIVYYHNDKGKFVDVARIHIPITRPSKGYTMLLGGEPIVLEPGRAYMADFGIPHTLWNFGSIRTTLLLDIKVSDMTLLQGPLGEELKALKEDAVATEARLAMDGIMNGLLEEWRGQPLAERKAFERRRAAEYDWEPYGEVQKSDWELSGPVSAGR